MTTDCPIVAETFLTVGGVPQKLQSSCPTIVSPVENMPWCIYVIPDRYTQPFGTPKRATVGAQRVARLRQPLYCATDT